MAGGERGRLVEEEELRVVPAPDVAAPVLEFADANEPVLVFPAAAAKSLIVAMQPPAAIAHEPATLGDGVQFAERIDAILQRPGSLRHAWPATVAFHERQVHASRLGVSGGGDMALELRPNCEYCDKDLPPDAREARICTYECTFCADCVERHLSNVCPNCGGGFAPRPIRPAREWRPGLSLAKRPASTKRVGLSYSREEIARFVREVVAVPPERR